MTRLIVCCLVAAFAVAAAPVLIGQDKSKDKKEPAGVKEPDANDPAHKELGAMRDAVVKAVNTKDIDGLLKHLHPNVVVVWQNAEISRGHKGVREYYEKHLGGTKPTLESYTVKPEVKEYAALYGKDNAVSFGTMKSQLKFKGGKSIELEGPWSATMVKDDGEWKIVSFHASVGLFDNPLVAASTQMLYWGCGIAAGAGLVIGGVVVALLMRKKA